jgi:hypothetical protein
MTGFSPLSAALFVAGAGGIAVIILTSDKALLYVAAAIGGALFLLYSLSAVASGYSQKLLSLWVLAYPLAYYFLSFPIGHPVFTLDRIVVAILAAVLIAERVTHLRPLPTSMRNAGLCWTGFLVAALISLHDVRGHNLLYSVRLLADTFVMPGILTLYVIRRFDVRQYGSVLTAVCIMSIYLAGIGITEALLHEDLLPLNADNTFALGDDVIFRANGPFDSGSTYGLVGVINALLISFLRAATPMSQSPYWQRTLIWVGLLASILVSLIPLHRGILVTWVAIGLIELWRNSRNAVWWRRTAWRRLALVVGAYLTLFAVKAILPDIYQDRIENPANIYGRLAQYQQSQTVLMDHLWLGTGFGQFGQVVIQQTKYLFFFRGVPSVDSPHNTLVSIATETGLLGLCLFISSQMFLVVAFLQLRRNHGGFQAWWSFVSIFVAYWVFGMDVSSGYLSELNIWYMFSIGVCFRYAHSSLDCPLSPSMRTKLVRPIMPTTSISEGTC